MSSVIKKKSILVPEDESDPRNVKWVKINYERLSCLFGYLFILYILVYVYIWINLYMYTCIWLIKSCTTFFFPLHLFEFSKQLYYFRGAKQRSKPTTNINGVVHQPFHNKGLIKPTPTTKTQKLKSFVKKWCEILLLIWEQNCFFTTSPPIAPCWARATSYNFAANSRIQRTIWFR